MPITPRHTPRPTAGSTPGPRTGARPPAATPRTPRLALAAAALWAGLVAAPQAMAQQGLAGAYLAARHAQAFSDYEIAADYFTRALQGDPENTALMEGAVGAYVGLGQVDKAAPLAERLAGRGTGSQLAAMVVLAERVHENDWDAVLSALDDGLSVGPLFDGLVRAWSMVGQGRMQEALAEFDAVTETDGVRAFGLYHKALALASAGDYESAADILSAEDLRLGRRGVIAHAQVLSQLDRDAEGAAVIEDVFGGELDGGLEQLRDRLDAGETVDYDIARTAQDGVAEVFFSISNVLGGEASEAYTLLYTRLTQYLRPDHVDSKLVTAGLLEQLDRHALAIEVYREVPRDDPSFDAAELGRADALRRSGKNDAAIEVLEQLTETRPDLPLVFVTLGDALREMDRMDEAGAAYDKAVARFDGDQPNQWIVYFARGITREKTGRWDEAESDFRKALELQPDQPQVLNYLGYSLVERQENLDEALEMIERAVAARPDSGYIVDSLGWVLYRLGRYTEAVEPMEKAVELMPVDPVVNDHLGDVYWAVGRALEAQFQWKRALSFVDEDSEEEAKPDRIRRKLEVGLDAVLEEEGADPLAQANEG